MNTLLIIIGVLGITALGLFGLGWAAIKLWFSLPSHNPIGGKKNSLYARAGSVLFAFSVGLYWYWLLSYINISVVVS